MAGFELSSYDSRFCAENIWTFGGFFDGTGVWQYWRCRTEACYMLHIYTYVYEDSIMKPTKYCLKRGLRKCIRASEIVQSTMYISMEMPNWNAFVKLLYTIKKLSSSVTLATLQVLSSYMWPMLSVLTITEVWAFFWAVPASPWHSMGRCVWSVFADWCGVCGNLLLTSYMSPYLIQKHR
jgi:hypothetical protein